MATEDTGDRAFSVINTGTYGLSYQNNNILISLVRSPAYAGHPIYQRDIVPRDRLTPRIDQGERQFRFFLNGGKSYERRINIDRESLIRNEIPMALSFFPAGSDGVAIPKPLVIVEAKAIQVSAVKKSEKGDNLVLRLFESSGNARKVKFTLPLLGISHTLRIGKFEIKTFLVNIRTKRISETGLLEE